MSIIAPAPRRVGEPHRRAPLESNAEFPPPSSRCLCGPRPPVASALQRAASKPAVRKYKPKSKSERGRDYRARRKRYIQTLAESVSVLRDEIVRLDLDRRLTLEQVSNLRHASSGSLVHLIREYFAMFRFGFKCADGHFSSPAETGRVSRFFQSHVDNDAIICDYNGIKALEDQWRMYSEAHASMQVLVTDIVVHGDESDPMVVVLSDCHVRLCRRTFEVFFPRECADELFIQRFFGLRVTYPVRTEFSFTRWNQIATIQGQVDFCTGLLNAGATIRDVVQLMSGVQLRCGYCIDDSTPMSPSSVHTSSPSESSSSDGDPMEKMSMKFLLAE